MLVLHVIWIIAAILVTCAVILWIVLLVVHSSAKRRDRLDAGWHDVWMERLLDVLDGAEPVESLPIPGSKAEMEAVIGLLREFGERFRGSYGGRMSSVLTQIRAADFGLRLVRRRGAEQRIRGCALLAWCGPSAELDGQLHRTLEDGDPRVVLEAAAALVRRGAVEDIVPVVRALCRSGAARSLLARDVMRQWGRTATRDWSTLLAERWSEEGWTLLLEAAGTAARGEWTPLVVPLVRHPSPGVATTALMALQESGDPDGAAAAEAASRHDMESVREQAVRTLVVCGDPGRVIPVLEDLLLDESFDVRRAAMDGILKLGGRARLQGREPADPWQHELFKEAGLLASSSS
ncbi:HEAT repeat domain-containing protein [Luteolibacter sp. SL250]|uniref:HEAT repeat domain-containing protein n=1 Tax=Luteolibacter sp. SL250 TaxID=2995170 RepID=UPI00226E1832|nr:HEAT repeat domain-containing protein [Luteolibacter sp. SL250]WAC20876.1 HEAT repeat domain-containing protein [Luteolibacter sp. SL250]